MHRFAHRTICRGCKARISGAWKRLHFGANPRLSPRNSNAYSASPRRKRGAFFMTRSVSRSWSPPKAMDLSNTVLQCLLPALSLWVGQWADRVHALAQLYREISTDAACRLVAIWRDAAQAESSPVHAEPVPWQAAAENAWRALSELSRRPAKAAPG